MANNLSFQEYGDRIILTRALSPTELSVIQKEIKYWEDRRDIELTENLFATKEIACD